jgi:hypothetical protein
MTAQRPSVLPPELAAKLSRLGASLKDGPPRHDLEDVLRGLSVLPANMVVKASREIATGARLGWWEPSELQALRRALRTTEADLMRTDPDYAWLFLFHTNGHVRQDALEAIQTPPASPFWFAALAWRLNDWVPQVRRAAMNCATRVLPATDADVAAVSALYLLDRRFSWGRWNDEQQSLDTVFGRQDVMALVADFLREGMTGSLATCLRYALRYPAMDAHLPRLAAEASQPAVRAVAYRCLVSGQASWPIGYEWIWIDKVYGISKRVPALGARPIAVTTPLEVLIAATAQDRSSTVRRIAADAVMAVEGKIPNGRAMIAQLAKDRSAAVRARADFMIRKGWGEANSE